MKKDVKEAAKEAETTLESEVSKIVNEDDAEVLADVKTTAAPAPSAGDDEDFETTETITYNEDGDIELGEEDVIDESTMKQWCNMSYEVR